MKSSYNLEEEFLTTPGRLIRVKNEKEGIDADTCWWKYHAFSKNKRNEKIFIETGTFEGDGILTAFGFDFEKYYSIEIQKENYEKATNKWKHKQNVKLYLGATADRLQEILNEIDEPSFFWLDAHFHDSSPTYKELEMIKEHSIKNHTILIDDISIYFDKNHIEKTLLGINPDYVISYEPTWRGPNEILVAKIL